MKSKQKVAACIVNIEILKQQKKTKKRKSRSCWIKPWIQRRNEKEAYSNILTELRLEDPGQFRKYLRMNEETYEVRKLFISTAFYLIPDVGKVISNLNNICVFEVAYSFWQFGFDFFLSHLRNCLHKS